jgi:DNA primase
VADNKDQIEQIRLQNDIVDTISRYLPLKRAGNGRFKGLCPFHKEKTPSFQVDQHKQMFYCFGCQAGGDVFSFIMQYERVDFVEAAKILADRVGLRFEARGPGGSESGDAPGTNKQALYRLHEQVATYYADALARDDGAASVRDYLHERGLDEAIEPFQLGWAPDQPGALSSWARSHKVSTKLLEQAGILIAADRPGGVPYHRFRGRLMFPIRDPQGRVVGFSGRILDDSSPAKYVNSPETPLFHKGRLLYGLDRAREAIIERRQAILCEGQIDVIRCQLSGLPHAVAPQGTALTDMQATILKRYADEVLLMFDADNAGQKATLRAAEVLLAAGLTVRSVAMPAGEDPDSLVRSQGAEALQQRVEDSRSLVETQLAVLGGQLDLTTQAGQTRAAREVLALIVHAPSAVEREQHLRQAAAKLNISESALKQDMQRMHRPVSGQRQAAPEEAPPVEDEAAAAPAADEVTLIELMVAHGEVWDLIARYLRPDMLTHPDCRLLMQQMLALPEPDHDALMDGLQTASPSCRRLYARLAMSAREISGDEVSCVQAARDLIRSLWIRHIDRLIREAKAAAQTATDAATRQQWAQERVQRTYQKKKLQQGWESAAPLLDELAAVPADTVDSELGF